MFGIIRNSMEFKVGDKVAYNAAKGRTEGVITSVIPVQYHIKLADGSSTICTADCIHPINEAES